ncbi:hypothetical protein GCM10023320_02960 [Pseudonocardia adelaidensis]|uniref:Uncharacterized protein n=1 Tax=Pseudonocardia adelaidensis TaxID=648754 RepID=A0ABP9N772_9PSEU
MARRGDRTTVDTDPGQDALPGSKRRTDTRHHTDVHCPPDFMAKRQVLRAANCRGTMLVTRPPPASIVNFE